jgi:hypothetical protein
MWQSHAMLSRRSTAKPHRLLSALVALPGFVYLAIVAVIVAAMACKAGTRYSFNVNEGWNAYWASAAWSGADLYPPLSGLRLDNYLPGWFYVTGALGRLVGDIILAGRALAAIALLLIGLVLSLIARELVGAQRGWWLAGVAFVALFGLHHQDYAAADDPQIFASLLMTVALWLVVRSLDEAPSLARYAGVVLLMLAAGLIKHNIVAPPLAIALFFLCSGRWRALAIFVGLSAVAVAIAGAGLYAAYGRRIFALLLLPKPYNAMVAWDQTREQLKQYGLVLAVVPFLAIRSDAKTRLILVYAGVALALGAVLSGSDGVDVNVFFDFLFCIAIGLGVMGTAVMQFVGREGAARWARWAAAAGWIAVALLSPTIQAVSSRDTIADALRAVADGAYAADLQYIRAAGGPVVCRDPTLCYWAGRPQTIDLNNMRSIARAEPALEAEVVAQIESCRFALIQLGDDWDDRENGPLTDRIRDAIEEHYKKDRTSKYGLYWRPQCG